MVVNAWMALTVIQYRLAPDLQTLQDIEEVVHARQVLHVLEDGHQQGGGDGDGTGQQHPGETRPAQVQETLRARRIASL